MFVTKFVGGLGPGSASAAPKFSFDATVAHSISLSLRLSCLLWHTAIEYIFSVEDQSGKPIRSSITKDLVGSITSGEAVGALQVWQDWLDTFDVNVQQSTDISSPLKQLLTNLEPFITDVEMRTLGACSLPKFSESSSSKAAGVPSIHMLLQISFFIHNIDALTGWMCQSEQLYDSDEHKEAFGVLQRETSMLRSLLFQSKVKSKADPKQVLITIRNSLQKASAVISKAASGSKGSADSSALRQCIAALREAVTTAEDVFEAPGTQASRIDSHEVNEVGDILHHSDSIWQYLASVNTTFNRLIFRAQSADDSALVPAWRSRCLAIQNTLTDWEKAQNQIQVILTQKKAVESELENRRDELNAALRRCEELAALAAKSDVTSAGTGRVTRRSAQSKLDEEVKVINKYYEQPIPQVYQYEYCFVYCIFCI